MNIGGMSKLKFSTVIKQNSKQFVNIVIHNYKTATLVNVGV